MLLDIWCLPCLIDGREGTELPALEGRFPMRGGASRWDDTGGRSEAPRPSFKFFGFGGALANKELTSLVEDILEPRVEGITALFLGERVTVLSFVGLSSRSRPLGCAGRSPFVLGVRSPLSWVVTECNEEEASSLPLLSGGDSDILEGLLDGSMPPDNRCTQSAPCHERKTVINEQQTFSVAER